VAITVTGRGRVRQIAMAPHGRSGGTAADARTGGRPAYFDGRFVDTPCYDRSGLGPGASVSGPAVIEQLDCTTVVLPGQIARVDGYLNLVVQEER
jgi:N-methylhydantoinase A